MTETTTTPTPPEGLTDERLLELAAAAIGYDSIAPGEYEEKSGSTVHAYGSELIAYGRAAIAAHEAARPAHEAAKPHPAGERKWPKTFSGRQRARETATLCAEAGLDVGSFVVWQIVRDAENGMPLRDVCDLINYYKSTPAP